MTEPTDQPQLPTEPPPPTEPQPVQPLPQSPTQEWDERYSAGERIWSGQPNAALVREAADLPPGRALDLGSGEGADAIWLAEQGCQVTGIDISQVALAKAEAHATSRGVTVDWQQHDLQTSFPAGAYDLVSAMFLHSRGELDRVAILRRAAAAVAPGGVLLIVGHDDWPAWAVDHDPSVHFDSPAEVLAFLDLPAGQWETLVSESYERPVPAPDGTPASRKDNTLRVRRLS